jgi:predicted transglutaminase-like cysteine proteinase
MFWRYIPKIKIGVGELRKLLLGVAALTLVFITSEPGPAYSRDWNTRILERFEAAYSTPKGGLKRILSVANGGHRTAAPLAFQLFCLKSPNECKAGGRMSIDLTSENLSELHRVNRLVNRSIRPQHDPKVDVWAMGPKSGDCKAYTLTKRQHLIQAGFPASALRIAVTRTQNGEGHAVLVVRTSSGDRILDNRTNSIRTWAEADLELLKMSTSNPMIWR